MLSGDSRAEFPVTIVRSQKAVGFEVYYRTHTCGELNASNVGQQVSLAGWVNRRRDHGGLVFLDIRDRYGITQVICDPERSPEAHRRAHVTISCQAGSIQASSMLCHSLRSN